MSQIKPVPVINTEFFKQGQAGKLATSDHDPTATRTVTVFERYTKGTNYASDPAAMFSPWNIVEARIDGSGERTCWPTALSTGSPSTTPADNTWPISKAWLIPMRAS